MRALISVSDKRGIVEFAKGLAALGVEIISTGGTATLLEAQGVSVIKIDEVTDFPEMLDGRVKTLHPKIHGGLLALRDNAEHMATCKAHAIEMIDLVVVNLYPFEKTTANPNVSLEEAIENIDIGGPSMLRSAAKNYRSVTVITSPDDYEQVLGEMKASNGEVSLATRTRLATTVFLETARYDAMISQYLLNKHQAEGERAFPNAMAIGLSKVDTLRYGENPHQAAAFYRVPNQPGLADMEQLHGKALSYNNLIDVDAAWQIAKSFEIPGAAIIKHTNPCGAAVGDNLAEAYQKAYDADPISAFGSIIGLNREVDVDTAEKISQTFVEVVIAPNFTQAALDILTQKPNLRLLKHPNFNVNFQDLVVRHVPGGILVQEPDTKIVAKDEITIATDAQPTAAQLNDCLFAFALVKHIKSNAIVVVKNGQSIGVGAGQMSRVESVDIALAKAGDKLEGAVLASDAFFPFKDSVELAIKAGVKAIIQPGGSKRDQETIDACNAAGVPLVFTGVRHFKH